MIEGGLHHARRRRGRGREDRGPLTEPHEHGQLLRRERLDHQHLIGDRIRDLHGALGRRARLREVAGIHRRRRLELHVVRVVHHRIEAAGAGGLDVALVDGGRVGVTLRGFHVLPGADVDVRRHVNEVTRARHERLEAAGLRHRALRRLRRFDRVNVIVIRPRMVWIARHHAFERGDDPVGARLRRAVLLVQGPRPQVHQALGMERRDVVVFRELFRQRAHRVRVRPLANGLIAGWIGDVSLCQRVDEPLLHFAAGALACPGLGEMRVGLLQSIRRRDVVDVGAECQRHAPMRHRRRGILRGRKLERLEGLFVVETVEKRQAFIEELLRVGVRGLDRAVIRAKVAEQRRPRRLRGRGRGAVRIVGRLIGRRRRRGFTGTANEGGQHQCSRTKGDSDCHTLCLRLISHNTVSAPNNRLATATCQTCAAGISDT